MHPLSFASTTLFKNFASSSPCKRLIFLFFHQGASPVFVFFLSLQNGLYCPLLHNLSFSFFAHRDFLIEVEVFEYLYPFLVFLPSLVLGFKVSSLNYTFVLPLFTPYRNPAALSPFWIWCPPPFFYIQTPIIAVVFPSRFIYSHNNLVTPPFLVLTFLSPPSFSGFSHFLA